MADFFELGTIIRSHGIKGELVIYISSENPSHFRNLKALYIGDGDTHQKVAIKAIRFKDHLATVALDGINDRNTSDLYLKRKVFLPIDELPVPDGKEYYFHEVIGFNIHDKNLGDIGIITDVYEMPQHPVMALNYNGKEALIPATPDFILAIHRDRKILEMDLPDGLLDIYM